MVTPDPLCYGCDGTGELRGFGTPAGIPCPCTERDPEREPPDPEY